MGHFFQEEPIPNSNLMKETVMNNLEPSFHRCSLNEECNYVFKDTRSGEFCTRRSEADIPNDKRYLRVWKKIKQGDNNFVLHLYV